MSTEATATDRRAVLVTGASRGLGAAMAECLADRGHLVFAGMRRPTQSNHPGIRPIELDVCDQASIDAAASVIADEVGPHGLSALVNNAAVLEAGPLMNADPATVDRHLRTNVAGPLAVTSAVLAPLQRAHGRVVNVSSINARLPLPYWGLYSASKAALVALSDSLRMELADTGVTVTVVTLGAFDTDIRTRAMDAWPPEVAPGARDALTGFVGTVDATAAPVDGAVAAVVAALDAPVAPVEVAAGDGIDDLLALAVQPADVRAHVISALVASVPG